MSYIHLYVLNFASLVLKNADLYCDGRFKDTDMSRSYSGLHSTQREWSCPVQSTSVLLQSGPVWYLFRSGSVSSSPVLLEISRVFTVFSSSASSDSLTDTPVTIPALRLSPSTPQTPVCVGVCESVCVSVCETAGVNDCMGVEVDRLIKGTVQCTFSFIFITSSLNNSLLRVFRSTLSAPRYCVYRDSAILNFTSLNTCHVISESATYVQV